MKSMILLVALLVSVNAFADSSVVNEDMGPVKLVKKVITFPEDDCINHLDYHPGNSAYNWRCVVPLSDTVGALKLEPFDVQWGADAFDGKCIGRVTADKSFAAIELNRVPGHPVLQKSDALFCLHKAYTMANIENGISIFVLTTRNDIDSTPVITLIENQEQETSTESKPGLVPEPGIRKKRP